MSPTYVELPNGKQVIVCSICNGTGVCDHCHGKGTWTHGFPPRKEDCSYCNSPTSKYGVGSCQGCGGKGYWG